MKLPANPAPACDTDDPTMKARCYCSRNLLDGLQGELPADMSLQNADECFEVWQHLRPYAESLDKDSKTLSKLQGIHSVSFSGRDLMASH